MGKVRSYLAMRAPNHQLVDELAQETFLIAHQKLASFRSSDPILAWLQSIAWQLLRRERKRYLLDQKNHSRLIDHLSIFETAEFEQARDDRVEYLERCLERLDDTAKGLVEQRYVKGMNPKEMSDQSGKSSTAIRIALYRCRQQLRECIEQQSGKPFQH